MQLHFSPDELNLLADILLNQGDPVGVLDRVMARDFRFDADELDKLRDVLVANQENLRAEIAKADTLQGNALRARQSMLESMIEKISEACAML